MEDGRIVSALARLRTVVGDSQLEIELPPGVNVSKRGGGSPEFLRIDRYGRSNAMALRFDVFPSNMEVMDGQLVCFSTATRTRKVHHAEQCGVEP